MNYELVLPANVSDLLTRLKGAGFSAYVVGGCVRDSLMGLEPHDWDVCTSALPEQMQSVFSGLRTVETGLKHGTLTVVMDHVPYEVTTYRIDGDYTDHRHPDSVRFVDDLTQDLARRDFTVNAMAWSPDTGLADPFGGRRDLSAGLIRCVGEPEQRFEEDALRVLRALRFASVYGFAIEPATASALRAKAPDLKLVAGERVREELLKLLCGKSVGQILREYPEVLAEIIPEIRPMIGYDQQNHHHSFDLWEHTVRGVEGVPADPVLRLAMLLHDTGKPAVRTTDEKGEGHYKGHPKVSEEIARRTAESLHLDNAFRDRLCTLVLHHDTPLRTQSGEINTDRSFLLRRLNKFGEENLRTLFLIHCSDRIATGYSTPEREKARLAERMAALDALLAEQPCFTLKDLAVNGRDLTAVGLKGKAVGEALQSLLEAVMDGTVPNEKNSLLHYLSALPTSGC
ncbi:MAG: CCA tRNA nucleotidyltransferase [Clostridiales bacterium]|nr:CCA tRNA nucleotidyltransferase [Clostridiales bacterium]